MNYYVFKKKDPIADMIGDSLEAALEYPMVEVISPFQEA